MVLTLRMLSLDPDITLPLVMTLYIASPASVDNSGAGMADTIIRAFTEFGLDETVLNTRLHGGCYDGQLLICKVNLIANP